MLKKLQRLKQKKDNICMRTGCNNPVKRGNGTEFNYCSSSCQKSQYSPGSGELYDDFLDSPSYTSNQWGVWSPNQDDSPPSYSSINNKNDLFGSVDNAHVTPLWETDEPPLKPRYSSSSRRSKLDDDFPDWISSTVDPLWTPTPNKKNSRNYSPPITPRSNSPSDEEEIHCPQCTFFIRPNKTVCEMCGASITRQTRQTKEEPKKSNNKSSSKSKSTITSYRDLYEEEEEDEEEEEEEEEEEDDDNPFEDTPPRRNNKYSSSSNNYRNSSSSSRNRSSYDNDDYRNPSSPYKSRNRSSDDYEDDYRDRGSSYSQSRNRSSNNYEDDYRDRGTSYSQSRNQSSRNRTYRSPTPPIDELWIDDDDDFFESVPSRKPTRQRPPPKPYNTPSFFKETENRSRRNVQKPPTPPLKEKQIACPACNFDNHFSMTHCEICYTQLNKTPEQNNKKSTNFSNFSRVEQTRPKKICQKCSYNNDVNSPQCEMCYLPFEANRSIFSNFTSFFTQNVDYVDKTQCPTCTFMNHKSMAQCEVCQNVLPGANLIQQQQQYQEIVDKAPGPTTKLIQLPVNDHDYMTIQQKFKTGIPNGNILAIFRVIMPARIIQAHDAYKKQIGGNNPANVTHSMYHGSRVICDAKRYYGPPGWKYCAVNSGCGLCGITQNGNSCAKSNHGGRMWFARHSQTSLGYCRTDPVKAMFVEDIISATGGDIIIVDKEAATLVKFLIIFV